jgi:mono/diheme cytochrome c family protein
MASNQHHNRSASVALAAAALSLALTAAVTVSLSACAGPRWMGRGPAGYQSGGMPGGTMMGPGMGGYGRGMRGSGAGMPGYGPGMMDGYGPGMRGTRPGGRGYGPGYGPGAGGAMLRHRLAMTNGIPSEYARLSNPLPASRDVIAAGETLYQANCSACHGSNGAGDGPAGAGMSPPPANLRWTVQRPIAGDGYLMWAISDGGAQLGSGMPAFAGALSDTDRWRIIRYLRTL